MRNPGGQATIVGGEGVVNFDGVRKEFVKQETLTIDTFTCFHCNGVVHVEHKPDVNAVGFCRNCMRPICEPCAALPCIPYEKKLELLERKIERAHELNREYDGLLRGMW